MSLRSFLAKRCCMALVLPFFANTILFAGNLSFTVSLENGVDLRVEEHINHRWLPHSYYDQALDSIKTIYPESQIVVKRRYGSVGDVRYSLLCYKESKVRDKVIVNGVAVKNGKALIFSAEVPEFKFEESLVLTMELVFNFSPSKIAK